MNVTRRALGLTFLMTGIALISTQARAAETGYQAEVTVKQPTRLDWEFVASAFGKDAARLPNDYESTQQRYQFFAPKTYDASKNWPLIVFISPGDDPMGWKHWQKVCEEHDVLFCAPYGAGNNCPLGKRVRIVLDMLDDVRRQYRVDPDQTYVTGFSGGGRMACTIGFALPEYFGGVMPVCGTNPLPKLDYLRLRVQDRLSVAFITGEKDFNRTENENVRFPFFQELSIRSRLWVVAKMGHSMPDTGVLGEALKFLDEDLKRRRADARERPGLAASPTEAPTSLSQAKHLLETAEEELKQPDQTFRAVAMLQGVKARWGKTEPAEKATALLKEIADDPKRLKLVEEQGGAEERLFLGAQARSEEKWGNLGGTLSALKAWDLLAKQHPQFEEGKKAAGEAKRIREVLAKMPYLGVQFEGESTTVQSVATKGPADQAGLQTGDKVTKLGDMKVANLAELLRVVKTMKPGDALALEIQRKGKTMSVTVEVGKVPAD
jgi:hypothetical protein